MQWDLNLINIMFYVQEDPRERDLRWFILYTHLDSQ